MSRIVLVLFAVLAVSSAIPYGYDDVQCGPNEEYKSCGSLCRPTCGNPHAPACGPCVIGCACKDGYVTGRAGLCILPQDC